MHDIHRPLVKSVKQNIYFFISQPEQWDGSIEHPKHMSGLARA